MNTVRIKVWTVAGVVIFNLVLFILSAQYIFLANVHHHWVLPWSTAALGVQLLAVELIPTIKRSFLLVYLRNTVLSILFIFCVIGMCRYQTIFACFGHCSPKLATMLVTGGLLFLWSSYRYQKGHRLVKTVRGIGYFLLVMGVLVFMREFGHANPIDAVLNFIQKIQTQKQ